MDFKNVDWYTASIYPCWCQYPAYDKLYYSFARSYHCGKAGWRRCLCIISYKCMWIYHYLKKAIWKKRHLRLVLHLMDGAALNLPAPPYLPVPLVHPHGTWLFLLPRTPLPLWGNQPPFSLFLSSRTGSGPGGKATRLCGSPAGCPRSRWDVAAPAPHNSDRWGRQRFGHHKTRAWALWPRSPSYRT